MCRRGIRLRTHSFHVDRPCLHLSALSENSLLRPWMHWFPVHLVQTPGHVDALPRPPCRSARRLRSLGRMRPAAPSLQTPSTKALA